MDWFVSPANGHLVVRRSLSEVVKLAKSVARNGRNGGFQSLQYYHAMRLDEDGSVIITDPVWIERTIRYCTRYGDGGFQNNTGGRGRYGAKR